MVLGTNNRPPKVFRKLSTVHVKWCEGDDKKATESKIFLAGILLH
jgi:hypothetical protein